MTANFESIFREGKSGRFRTHSDPGPSFVRTVDMPSTLCTAADTLLTSHLHVRLDTKTSSMVESDGMCAHEIS